MKVTSVRLMVIATAVAWVMKDVYLVALICMQCEKFYLAVEDANSLCVLQSKRRNRQDHFHRVCKSVLQLNAGSFSKMSACGVFYVDATLPLRLMQLLTNYIIVLLQFVFL
ncbi:uncharacterized protein LOC142982815 [Anticarsia gemmatalis]|uniref:uncharacterized protein LOC142982815 n=1 Tax=Anticarsia gemmatalis TaxID=129554 RepID=UPI003F768296